MSTTVICSTHSLIKRITLRNGDVYPVHVKEFPGLRVVSFFAPGDDVVLSMRSLVGYHVEMTGDNMYRVTVESPISLLVVINCDFTNSHNYIVKKQESYAAHVRDGMISAHTTFGDTLSNALSQELSHVCRKELADRCAILSNSLLGDISTVRRETVREYARESRDLVKSLRLSHAMLGIECSEAVARGGVLSQYSGALIAIRNLEYQVRLTKVEHGIWLAKRYKHCTHMFCQPQLMVSGTIRVNLNRSTARGALGRFITSGVGERPKFLGYMRDYPRIAPKITDVVATTRDVLNGKGAKRCLVRYRSQGFDVEFCSESLSPSRLLEALINKSYDSPVQHEMSVRLNSKTVTPDNIIVSQGHVYAIEIASDFGVKSTKTAKSRSLKGNVLMLDNPLVIEGVPITIFINNVVNRALIQNCKYEINTTEAILHHLILTFHENGLASNVVIGSTDVEDFMMLYDLSSAVGDYG